MERLAAWAGPLSLDDIELTLTDAPSDVVGNGLAAFNTELMGSSPNRRPPGIAIHSRKDGSLLGGLCGRTGFRRLFVELLFVPEALRGRGLGAALLQQAEAEAKARDCLGACSATRASFCRKTFRRPRGYEVARVASQWARPRLAASAA